MPPLGRVTEDEYLAGERVATQRHELINGQVVAMAGGSPRHNAICANLLRVVGTLLRGGPCTPLTRSTGARPRHRAARRAFALR